MFNDFGNWLLQLLYWLPGMLVGFVFHEFAHAFAADRLGDPTPRMMGRLTLNPLNHIDPLGFVMLIVARFGWAKPVMTNPSRYKIKRYGTAIVALAGPLTNMVMGFLFLMIVLSLSYFGSVSQTSPAMMILSYAAQINFVLMTFNMLPIPPLDGYNILKDTVLIKVVRRPQALWSFERYGTLILIALMFLGPTSYIISTVISFFVNLGVRLFALVVGI